MSPRGWMLFSLCSVIWGVPYLLIRVAVDAGVSPGFIAWARVALGASTLLPIALRRGSLRPLRGRGGAVAAYTACEIAVPFVLIAVGERYITSSLAAILVATMPLLVALLSASLVPAERPSLARLVGLVTGFAGVAALLGLDIGGRPGELLGAALVLVATLGYAVAPIIVSRKLADLDPLGPVAASLALATIVLLPAALAAPPQGIPSLAAVGSLIVLGIVCTALGLVAFFALIAETGPGRASVITYVNPLVAVIAGSLILDERIGPATLVGLVLILVGSWLSTAGPSPPGAEEPGMAG